MMLKSPINKEKKSQTSMEFVFLIGIAFMAVLVFTVVGYNKLKDISDEKEFVLVKDLAFKVQNEINLAANVDDGYRRDFTLPQKLDYVDYGITINNNTLIVESKNHEYVLLIPAVRGNITKGDDVICKNDGVIELNNCP